MNADASFPLDEEESNSVQLVREVMSDFVTEDIPIPVLGKIRAILDWIDGFREGLMVIIERGMNGYAREDAHTGTAYILHVIAGICEETRERGDGSYPEELEDSLGIRSGLEVWYDILSSIERATRRFSLCLLHSENLSPEEFRWAQDEANTALLLFAQWYDCLMSDGA